MDKTGEVGAAKFINALIKSLQTLCHGYLEFQNGIEIIGHINLSVDKGNSLDYVLKEKVCKNAENSTLFISNSFHAEAKPEDKDRRKQILSDCDQGVVDSESIDQNEVSQVSSALSSICSSLTESRDKHRRTSDAKESHSFHYKSSSKRKSSLEQGSEFHVAKIPHLSSESSHRGSSSPARSRANIQGLVSSDGGGTSETLLPQTANVSDNSDLGVNLAGSVLEPVENQNDSDLSKRDDDSDGDLEVTFIKEEYGQGEGSDFSNSTGHQFTESQRDGSGFPVALQPGSGAPFMPGSFDHSQQFSPGGVGASTSQSQPGPSGMRGVSGIQSFVNSLSAFGSLGAPGLPLSQIGGSVGPSRHKGLGGLAKASCSNLSVQRPGSGYSKSHSSLQRAFALHREDKRKRQEGTSEDDLKQRLELMSELLTLKGISSTEDYKTALVREKRRLAKKLYRASLPEEKKTEIKEKDKLHKRLKRATRWAAASASMSADATQHFSDCSSDVTCSGKDFEGVPRTSPDFGGSFAAVGSVSIGGISDKGPNIGGNSARLSTDSSRIASRPSSGPGSDDNIHGMGSESLGCDAGVNAGSVSSISRIGSSCLGNMSRMCSTSATHVQVGTDPMESFADTRPGPVSSSSMVFGSVGGVPWMDSVSFDTASHAQEQRHLESEASQRDSYLMKLSQR